MDVDPSTPSHPALALPLLLDDLAAGPVAEAIAAPPPPAVLAPSPQPVLTPIGVVGTSSPPPATTASVAYVAVLGVVLAAVPGILRSLRRR